MTVGAHGDCNRSAIVLDQDVVNEGCLACAASRVDGHSTLGAGVKGHSRNLADRDGSVVCGVRRVALLGLPVVLLVGAVAKRLVLAKATAT